MKITQILAAITLASFSLNQASAWCFLLPAPIGYDPFQPKPPTITYNDVPQNAVDPAHNNDADFDAKDALTAGRADQRRVNPIVSDLQDGRLLMTNPYAVDRWEVLFRLSNGTEKLIPLAGNEAIALTKTADLSQQAYFIIQTSYLSWQDQPSNNSDTRALGNFAYWYTFDLNPANLAKTNYKIRVVLDPNNPNFAQTFPCPHSGDANSRCTKAYIRTKFVDQGTFPAGTTIASIKHQNFVHWADPQNKAGNPNKYTYRSTSSPLPSGHFADLPYAGVASEAPFTTKALDTPVIGKCVEKLGPDCVITRDLSMSWKMISYTQQ